MEDDIKTKALSTIITVEHQAISHELINRVMNHLKYNAGEIKNYQVASGVSWCGASETLELKYSGFTITIKLQQDA